MVNSIELEKIFSALIIPMYEDQSINYDALGRLVDLQIQDGVEGFLLLRLFRRGTAAIFG